MKHKLSLLCGTTIIYMKYIINRSLKCTCEKVLNMSDAVLCFYRFSGLFLTLYHPTASS